MRWWKKLKAKFNARRQPQPVTPNLEDINVRNAIDAALATLDDFANPFPGHRSLILPNPSGSSTFYYAPEDTYFFADGVTANGIYLITDALMTEKFANIKTLNLSRNQFDDEGVIFLMHAIIASGKKRFHSIDLSDTQISDGAAIAIAEAMIAGCFPAHFKLLLRNTHIGDAGAIALAEAMTHPNCPKYFELHFDNILVGNAGAEVFHDALKNNKFKQHVKLRFRAGLTTEYFHLRKEIDDMAKHYAQRYAARRLLTFYKGLTDPNSPVSLLRHNLDVLPLIAAHVIPRAKKLNLKIKRRHYKHKHGTLEGFLPPHLLFAKNIHTFYKNNLRNISQLQQEDEVMVIGPSPTKMLG